VNPRRLGTLGLLVVLGVAGGFGLGAVMAGQDPDTYGEATPVPASPSVPEPSEPTVEPTKPYAPDIDYPRLVPPTSFTRYRISNDLQTWSYLAPRGWTAYSVPDNLVIPPSEIKDRGEVRFRPSGEDVEGGYSLRVKEVNDHVAPATMLSDKMTGLADLADVVYLDQTDDSLYFTYRDGNNKLRYNFFRWFAAPGSSEATLEMSVVGRKRDDVGLQGIFEQFKSGLRPID
jgi:hypothetical protein